MPESFLWRKAIISAKETSASHPLFDPSFVFVEGHYKTPPEAMLSYEELVLPSALMKAAPKRQCEFLAGRYCANFALTKLGIKTEILPIEPSGQPLWPKGIVGSISHSNGLAVSVAGLNDQVKSLGVDIEYIVEQGDAELMIDQVATFDELSVLLKNFSYAEAFTILFSCKESIYKLLFPFVQRLIDYHEVRCISVINDTVTFGLARSLSDEVYGCCHIDVTILLEGPVCLSLCNIKNTHKRNTP